MLATHTGYGIALRRVWLAPGRRASRGRGEKRIVISLARQPFVATSRLQHERFPRPVHSPLTVLSFVTTAGGFVVGSKDGSMLKDGHYTAWFRTERAQGTGRVLLSDGKIFGGDTVITYGGSYQVDGSRFTATLTTRRHAPGQPSVFGVDEVEIRLAGTAIGNFAFCAGEVQQVPGMLFEATLIPVQEEGTRTERRFDPADFHPERLPTHNVR